jgi:hypothetical protein
LRKHPDLIDEFFTVRKVVVGDLTQVASGLTGLSTGQNDIKEMLELLISGRVAEDAPSGMRAFLQQAEANNPGCSVKATSTSDGTLYEIKTDGEASVEFGKLRFPATDSGKRGETKFLEHLDFGHEVELEPGEFVWESSFKQPLPTGKQEGQLRLRNKPPSVSLPVRLDAVENGKTVASVKMTQLKVVRAGRREVELEIGGGRFAGSIQLTLTLPESSTGTASLSLNLAGHDVVLAAETLEWLGALVRGASLTVWSLSEDALFGHANFDLPISVDEVEGGLHVLRDLKTINQEFGLDLTYPEVVDEQTARLIELIATAVKYGRFGEPIRTTVILDLPAERANELAVSWRTGKPFTLSMDSWVEHHLLGNHVELGEAKIHVVDAAPALGLDELESRLASVGFDEFIRVALTGSQLVYEFARYLDTLES